jgi:trimeric autotransporter adhesin
MKINAILPLWILYALSMPASGVTPPPDGGYPGYNTAEGQNALFSLTTGPWNTALGAYSLYSDTTGRANTAVGLNAMRLNVKGEFNTAVGVNALFANDGDPALSRGSNNCAFGVYALFSNTTGSSNTATGSQALASNTNGVQNVAFGAYALQHSGMGAGNTAIGSAALNENTTGSFNTAVGTGALLTSNGDGNTVVGSGAGGNVGGANHVICIGQGVAGANANDSCYIGSIWNQPGGPQAVYVNSDGKLGALISSQRFKDGIQSMDDLSSALFSLRPVIFHYKKEIDPKGISQFGLVAEEVDKVNPDLVLHDKEGKPYSVRYDQVNAMLLNEFLKEHRNVQELEATVTKQAKGLETLTNRLKEHAAQLQKVSTQVQMNNFPKMVLLGNP